MKGPKLPSREQRLAVLIRAAKVAQAKAARAAKG
jgi:hypothetical protein